jgi:hypothetical protein
MTTLEYGYICLVLFVTTLGTNTIVLYVTDYTGVRIYLSCMLLTTLEYEYICLVLFVTTRGTDTFVLYVTTYKTNISVLQCSQ